MSAGGRATSGPILSRAARARATRAGDRGGAGEGPPLSVRQRDISQQSRFLAIPIAVADRDAQNAAGEDQTQQVRERSRGDILGSSTAFVSRVPSATAPPPPGE